MKRRTMAVGVFDDPLDTQEAVRALRDAGFGADQIGVAVLRAPDRHESGHDAEAAEDAERVHVDETTGILAGGMLGGLAGWLIGAATIAVPGLGALVAAGALVTAVGGAGIGAAAGGLAGWLFDEGVSEDEAEYYHGHIRLGKTLVTVRDQDRADEAQSILEEHRGHNFHTRPA